MTTIFGSNRWTGPPGSAKSKHAEIHLWRVDLDRNAHSLLALESSLAPEERAKASAFRLERDRNRYIMAHGALRTILAWYLKAAPGELVFRCGVRGRPELADDAYTIVLTSGDWDSAGVQCHVLGYGKASRALDLSPASKV